MPTTFSTVTVIANAFQTTDVLQVAHDKHYINLFLKHIMTP